MNCTKNGKLHIFAGIDPSISSSGVAVWIKETNFYHLYNIRNKRTKKEEMQMPAAGPVDVVMYKYTDPNKYKGKDQRKFELVKTINLINITKEIKRILHCTVLEHRRGAINIEMYVCIETNAFRAGARSVSLVDLCGLNFLIRNAVIGLNNEFPCGVDAHLVCATPSEIKKYATGRGDADKELVMFCFSLLRPDIAETYGFMKLDDLADAYFMMNYAHSLYIKDKCKDGGAELSACGYSDEQEKLIQNKISETKNLKRERKIAIKNNKNKKSVWDDDMLSFADGV